MHLAFDRSLVVRGSLRKGREVAPQVAQAPSERDRRSAKRERLATGLGWVRWFVLWCIVSIGSVATVKSAHASEWSAPAEGGGEQVARDSAPAAAESEGGSLEDAPGWSKKKRAAPEPPSSFNLYDGGWIRFAYPPSERQRIQPLIAAAEAVRDEFSRRLGRTVLNDVSVHVARTSEEMVALAPPGMPYPKYAEGVAYSEMGLVLLTLEPKVPSSEYDLVEIFKHELAHVALYEAVEGRAVPRWFNEGLAVHLSREKALARVQTLWSATLSRELISLKRLERAFPDDIRGTPIAYAESADVVRFLLRSDGTERFAMLLRRIRRGQSFEQALNDAYGVELGSLEYEWREDVAKRYSFWPVFFGGSFVWMLTLGLFFFGWRKRRKETRATLARWEEEEAAEDVRARAVEPREERVHIVIGGPLGRGVSSERQTGRDTDVPKVEHEGNWHTLH